MSSSQNTPEQPETTYFAGNSEKVTKLHSGRTAENSIAYLLPHLERLYSQKPALSFLDVGCGPGSITLDLAQRFPKATFVGVDGSTRVIEQANSARAAAGDVANCRFQVADMMNLAESGFSGYDVVHVHQVLQHVPDPLGALKSLRQASNPETGLVSVREADWALFSCWPESRGFELHRELWTQAALKVGNDLHVAQRLHVLAGQVGWRREQIHFGYDGLWFFFDPSHKKPMAEAMIGRFDEDGTFADQLRQQGVKEVEVKLAVIREGWKEWLANEDAWQVMPCCTLVCRNGTGPW